MKNILLFTFAGACLCWFVGCGQRSPLRAQPKATSVHLTIVDKGGFAALQFGNWILVFEAIPAQSVQIGAGGSINYPDPVGYGGQDVSFGDLKVKQSWDGQANSISVNGNSFKLTDAGKKLAFADHTYEATDTPKTIVISKDGNTR